MRNEQSGSAAALVADHRRRSSAISAHRPTVMVNLPPPPFADAPDETPMDDDLNFLDIASAYAGVYRMPKSAGTPTSIVPVRPLQSDGNGWDFTVDDRAVYVTYEILESSTPDSAGVTIIDKATGAKRRVAPTTYGCTDPVVGRLAAFGTNRTAGRHRASR